VRVNTGDLVWVGVNGTHGFINDGDQPVRWLEAQSPVPPSEDAFYFPDDWKQLG
jgi:mannose-6-phosphate isomerase-like protein (cupin superfamily)